MGYRPRDICSAAFFNDVARLKLLAHQDAPGGLEYRFDLERLLARLAQSNNNADSGETDNAGGAGDAYEEDEEEEELDMGEELEAALAADGELARVRKLYTLEEEVLDEDEVAAAEAEDGDGGSGADAAGLYNADVIEADMAAQEADFRRFQSLLRHRLRERAVAAALQKQGFLLSGETPVEVASYGVMFAAKEGGPTAAPAVPLAVRWLPVRDSPYAAGPLHWAALGRAHDAIRFLVANGVDAESGVVGPGDGKAAAAGGFTFPPGLTAARMADMNASAETLRVLHAAVAEREAFLRALEDARQQVEGSLEGRKARQEKRKLGRDQRRVAREERAAAAEDEEEDEEEGREGSGSGNEGDTDKDGDD